MRKPNVELNSLKLAQKKLQLAQIENQLAKLTSQVEAVTERLNSKLDEISQIESVLNDTAAPAVSE